MRTIAVSVLFAMTLSTIAQAAIVFEIRTTKVTPGEVARVGVFVKGTENEPLEAYNLPIDIGGEGRGFPDGLSFAGVDIATDDYAEEVDTFGDVVISATGALPPVPPFDPRFEAVFSDNGATISLTPEALHLFNILIDIPLGFVGPLTVSISEGGFPDPLTVVSGTQTFRSSAPGTLELQSGLIVQVPEPSSIGFACLLLATVGFPRRR